MSLSGEVIEGIIDGPETRPVGIEYSKKGSAAVSAAELDYENDTLILKSGSRERFSSIRSYKIISVEKPNLEEDKEAFSWRAYRGEAGDLVASLTVDGESFLVDITDELEVDRLHPMMGHSRNNRSPTYLWLLGFLFVAVGPLALLAGTKRNKKTKIKDKND